MESSNPTSPIEAKKQIILKHLGNLDEKSLETFKTALCQLKPRGAAGPISMENLKDKSLEEIVDFIFKYHTEKHGTQTVKMTLAMINENQTKMLMDRELREASPSNVMVHKQDRKQVHTIIPNIVVPTAHAVPRSELSAHKIRGEPDRGAVLGTATNKEATTSKNEGPPKPASTSNVMVYKQDGKQVHNIIPNIGVPTARAVPCSEPSAKTIKIEHDSDAVLVTPTNKQATTSKNEGAAYNPPKPATHRRKNMEPKKIEASTSKVMVDKQDGKVVTETVIIIDDDDDDDDYEPFSDPSAKKIKIQSDRDAVLGVPENKEGPASKNEGPAHNPPRPASTSNVMVYKQDGKQVHNIIPDIGVPTARAVPCSEPSTKTIKIEHDSDAVLGTPTNKQATASKNEGAAYNPPKPASTSKVMVDKQDGNVVTETVIIIDDDDDDDYEPFSEPSAKKIKVEPDRDAVLGVPENKEGPASKSEGPAHNPPRPEQSEKAPPSISMEKKTSNIIVTHLEKLKDGDIEKFKEILCSKEPPIKNGGIQMSDINDKSLEEMVDLIIRRHTLRRGPATVRKVLELMKENQIIMLIRKYIRKLNQQQKKASDQQYKSEMNEVPLYKMEKRNRPGTLLQEEKETISLEETNLWDHNSEVVQRTEAVQLSYKAASLEPKVEEYQGLCGDRSLDLPVQQSAASLEPKVEEYQGLCGDRSLDLPVQQSVTERESAVYFPEECYPLECPLCGKDEDSAILVSPVINGMVFRLELQSSGLFRCSKTGIKFQVTCPVNIEYEIESWRNYAALIKSLNKEYEILGPLFNIKTSLEPGVVSAVYLPHCLCLKGLIKVPASITFMHCKDGNIILEEPARVEPYYVVLENPTFSPIGILWYPFLWIKDEITKHVPVHGMVLIYYRIVGMSDPNHKMYQFHLYLMPSNLSFETDIQNEEQKLGYTRIQKPPQTDLLYKGRTYIVNASENARVSPETLLFRSCYLAELYSYTEVRVKEKQINEEIAIYVKDGDQLVWETVVDRGEIMGRESASVEGDNKDITGSVPAFDEVPGPSSPSEHFVDKHRIALIDRLSHIDPVLDYLLVQRLLNQEQYEIIRKKEPHQEKMRQLYQFMTIWGNTDKDKLYRAIWRTNEPLIRDLEGC